MNRENEEIKNINHINEKRFRVPEPFGSQKAIRMGPGIILEDHDRKRTYSLKVPTN